MAPRLRKGEPDAAPPEARVAVYGATGYTGKLVAAELASAGASFVIAGRSADKLDRLAAELDASPEVAPAALDDPDALRAAFRGCGAVINCAGPFTLYGDPVIGAAIAEGAHYLDTTGEQGWIRKVIERHGPAAARAGVAAIPAMGFDYVPGDMLAALTAEGMTGIDEVSLMYSVRGFGATRGTMLSALEMISGGDVEWSAMGFRAASQSVSRGTFDFGGEIGNRRIARYPAGEHVTVPRHVRTPSVRTAITAASIAPHPKLDAALPAIARPAGIAMRTPLRRAVSRLIARLPEGPPEDERRAARFRIVCDVAAGDEVRRGVVDGTDVYGLTAAMVADGAIEAAGGGVDAKGGLAPAQAFDPAAFLGRYERFGVAWATGEPGEVAEPVPA